MKVGLYGHTHGIGYRDETNQFLKSIPATLMRPVEVAQRAERAGLHSMWFPDHVCMPISSTNPHVANESRARGYEPRHEILDGAVVMGAVATGTTRLKLGTAVLIAPYRTPLNDARQLATVDVLSGGRLVVGVGTGSLAEEFAALGISFKDRGRMTDECIEIYKRAWAQEVVSFSGHHYRFENVSMDPKPVQKPRPPISSTGAFQEPAPGGLRACATGSFRSFSIHGPIPSARRHSTM
jgi:probable F420-dependent oxidoreductase